MSVFSVMVPSFCFFEIPTQPPKQAKRHAANGAEDLKECRENTFVALARETREPLAARDAGLPVKATASGSAA